MSRQSMLLLGVSAAMITLAAVGNQKKSGVLLLEWASRAPAETPPRAILIEMGLKDAKAADWSGRARVAGARVVHREGYRFRHGKAAAESDSLLEPDAWQAHSHRPLRAPAGPVAVAKAGIATVGVVLHLTELTPEAMLTLHVKDQKPEEVTVALKDVVAGQSRPLWDGRAVVRLVSTATPVVTTKTEDDFPAATVGPDGSIWLAYISYTLKDETRRIEAAPLQAQPTDFRSYFKPDFGDQLLVKQYRDGKWSEPIALTDNKQDLVRCAIAVDREGDACVAYVANRHGRHRVFVRTIRGDGKKMPLRLSVEQEIQEGNATKPGPWLNPVLATSAGGSILLAFQPGLAALRLGEVTSGKMTGSQSLDRAGDCWHPALAAGPSGAQALAWDEYAQEGDYDVMVQQGNQAPVAVAGSSRFEARPSLCYDCQGRLWIAYEEGPEKWGKDFGALDDQDGNPLYFARTIRVVCLENGKLLRPAAELPPLPEHHASPASGVEVEAMPRYSNPRLGLDGKGRVWLAYRQKFGTRYGSHPGSHWLSFVRRLDGDHWTQPIELHHADGTLDSRALLLPHQSGGLRILHNTDGRFTTPDTIDNQVYESYVDLPGDVIEPKLLPHDAGQKNAKLAQLASAERAGVQRMRDYRIDSAGRRYQLLRGEFHRHTEFSWDGGPDGSLEDMFRYALDAAAMDWIGNGDHDNGAGREYSWWLIQKFTDAYHVSKRFTPMFSYERSVAYPQGHRNCVFAQRGVVTLPRLAAPSREQAVGEVHADDTKMLYRYLKELHGICASHTSATSMGTDWRDNDPEVEPIVEIYQGDRMSYEIEGAPRAGYDPKSGRKPANIAGWYPKGFINLALQEGYRLGFESSSDHFSTHISFCIALAERHDRAAILDALKKRHCYGATDNLIVDVRSGSHLMGDEFQTGDAPSLEWHVVGTDALAKVEILKDSAVVATQEPGTSESRGTWTDPTPTAGTHYFYVRVLQRNNEIAWSSPLWIKYMK